MEEDGDIEFANLERLPVEDFKKAIDMINRAAREGRVGEEDAKNLSREIRRSLPKLLEIEKQQRAAKAAGASAEPLTRYDESLVAARAEAAKYWDSLVPKPYKGGAAKKRSSRRVTAKRFCGCIKKVKSAKKNRTEGSAIAVCTSSLLWPHGRTLHSVSCRRKKTIKTQKRSAKSKK